MQALKQRNSVKLILLNSSNEILMIHVNNSNISSENNSESKASFWHMVGGQIEDGENIEEAAYRELFEETGLTKKEVSVGKIVWFGSVDLFIDDELVQVNQQFILARSSCNEITMNNLTEDEKQTVSHLKWFSLDEIKNTIDIVYPANLYSYLSEIMSGNIPAQPIQIDLSEKSKRNTQMANQNKIWNIGWGLTSRCNSRCMHCYNSSGEAEVEPISFTEARQIVDKLYENRVKTINYGTGESGLVEYFWDLVKYVYQKGILQGLTTNGFSVNKDTISLVKKYLNDVDVSLDYSTKKENNIFRGSEKAWDWAIEACNQLKEHQINFSIVTCLHSQNSGKEEIDRFLEICRYYKCDWRVNWFKPIGRGKVNNMLKLDPIKVHDVFKYIIERTKIVSLSDPYFSALLGIKKMKHAPCGFDSFRITPNTHVVPCVYFSREFVGLSIVQIEFNDVINSNEMQRVQNREIDYCKDCEYLCECGGGCVSRAYLENNAINSVDAFCYKALGIKDNPLRDTDYLFCESKIKVHENYLCTFIVRPRETI